ncbi:MAG: lytic murein transglycosylase [Alphaproteobacteria bacterium]
MSAVADDGFTAFVAKLKKEAVAKKLDTTILDKALGVPPKLEDRATKKSAMGKQAEFSVDFHNYVDVRLSDERVGNGQKAAEKYKAILAKVAEKYKVEPHVIVAMWGIETHYGEYKPRFMVIPSLASLAYQSHRKDFFKRELFAAMKVVQEKHVKLENMKGSWAGAMGQPQFMPTSFWGYAEDGDGDFHRDIWTNEADIFASVANFLKKNHWQYGQPWGQRVVLSKKLPKDLEFNSSKLTEEKPMNIWRNMGIAPASGALPTNEQVKWGRLFLPDGPTGAAYLLYPNFKVITRWNKSASFAFASLSLADAIAYKKPVKMPTKQTPAKPIQTKVEKK